jgi:hypothetical protein
MTSQLGTPIAGDDLLVTILNVPRANKDNAANAVEGERSVPPKPSKLRFVTAPGGQSLRIAPGERKMTIADLAVALNCGQIKTA